MDQDTEHCAQTECASHPAVPCPPTPLAEWLVLYALMEKALAGIANYYGRCRLAPYQHEPKAWVDVRKALQAASSFRGEHSGAFRSATRCAQLPPHLGASQE